MVQHLRFLSSEYDELHVGVDDMVDYIVDYMLEWTILDRAIRVDYLVDYNGRLHVGVDYLHDGL